MITVQSIEDLRKAARPASRDGSCVIRVAEETLTLLPGRVVGDELTDEEFERLIRNPVVASRLNRAVQDANAGRGIPDEELDDVFET